MGFGIYIDGKSVVHRVEAMDWIIDNICCKTTDAPAPARHHCELQVDEPLADSGWRGLTSAYVSPERTRIDFCISDEGLGLGAMGVSD